MEYDVWGDAFTVASPEDFAGWHVVGCEDWKPGVVRWHLVRNVPEAEFRMAYGPATLEQDRQVREVA